MKTLTMYRPLSIGDALSDFDRYMESFFGDSVMSPVDRILNRLPAVDVREKQDAYILEAELPGYEEKDIQVHMDGGNLTIESRQEEEKEKKERDKDAKNNGSYLIRERRTSSFSRSFKLPENADSEQVNATFKNGILTMEIKKRNESQKRLIRINAE
ncbi:MAG: Hsp20/alpha crystallin family protein [Treponema sp.]|jgi:HSP20 family protein|nr:Hsp20/alpha crystallin family protein [Treponema sp.]